MGSCAPCWPRGHIGGCRAPHEFISFHFFVSKSCIYTVVQNQSTFEKVAARPFCGARETTLQGLFTRQQRGSLVASPELHPPAPPPSIQFAPFLSSWRWASCCIRIGFRWRAGHRSGAVALQSTKGAVGLAFLCLHLAPTTLLPSSSARCSMQGTGRRLPGPRWVGGGRQSGGPRAGSVPGGRTEE